MKRNGVWRRARWDWAYRVEVAGYGSISGCGFQSREEARAQMRSVKADALRKAAAASHERGTT